MPPQQLERLLDVINKVLNFCTHKSSNRYGVCQRRRTLKDDSVWVKPIGNLLGIKLVKTTRTGAQSAATIAAAFSVSNDRLWAARFRTRLKRL